MISLTHTFRGELLLSMTIYETLLPEIIEICMNDSLLIMTGCSVPLGYLILKLTKYTVSRTIYEYCLQCDRSNRVIV